jgi:hypothetical protein
MFLCADVAWLEKHTERSDRTTAVQTRGLESASTWTTDRRKTVLIQGDPLSVTYYKIIPVLKSVP